MFGIKIKEIKRMSFGQFKVSVGFTTNNIFDEILQNYYKTSYKLYIWKFVNFIDNMQGNEEISRSLNRIFILAFWRNVNIEVSSSKSRPKSI